MSEKKASETSVRAEEAELSDEAVEQVAGGCGLQTLEMLTVTPTLPSFDIN